MARLRHIATALAAAILAALAGLGPGATHLTSDALAASPTTFSGRAVVLQGTVLGIPIPCAASTANPSLLPTAPNAQCKGVGDTGPLEEGVAEPEPLAVTAACYGINRPDCVLAPPNLTGGTLTAEALHAAVVARGNKSSAEASVAEFSLNVGGATISADVLRAQASAKCTGNGAVVEAGAATSVTINGTTYTVAAHEERKVGLNPLDPLDYSLGYVIINPGASGPRSGNVIDAAALRIVLPGGTDITVAEVHADIVCAKNVHCPGQTAFVTGGGYIRVAGQRAHFTAAGRNLTNWGHVSYKPGNIHVQKPYALVYGDKMLADLAGEAALRGFTSDLTGLDESKFQGGAIIWWVLQDGSLGGQVLVVDMGEPGRADLFEIIGVVGAGAGLVEGGNIQMHGRCV